MSPIHHVILALLFLVVGCCVGSFVNVCVARIPRGLSVLRPRSRCPQCLAAILVRDNIPILGWLVLRGRCRSCASAIPPRYLLVELGMGVAFATVYLGSAFFVSGDVWERNGAALVLAQLFVLWVAISIVVAVTLMVCDGRAVSVRLAHASGVQRQDQLLSWLERSGSCDSIRVQLGDLAGPPRVSEAISGDTAERFVGPNQVERRITAPGNARHLAP
jgi:prepilin signal peptidase PulO-like enzyme (type II secretory pathway)